MGTAAAKLAAAACFSCVLTLLSVGDARATLAYEPCDQSNQYACAHLNVPLDPSGRAPGTVALAIHRHRAPVGEATSAVIALAGGPGQAALPFTEEFTSLLGPIVATRDLIVFDQRGTGASGALSCHAFETPSQMRSPSALIAECAAQLGPGRSFYTSLDSVADIEAIREAGGYQKLVLYGTSYGTKVAELYAEEHPSHVEALVLDSVVPPEGPDPLNRSTFQAIPRVLRSICAEHACAHITRNPVADLGRVIARMHGGSLHGRFVNGHGRSRRVPVNANDLFGLLLAGDFSLLLRAEFVTAVRAAALHDNAPLVRLIARSDAPEPAESEAFDAPLYYATTCEEENFPWERNAPLATRLRQGHAAVAALPASAALPFTKQTVFAASSLEECAGWPPSSSPPPVVEGHLPNVPTLIVSGADDLRTPTANAEAVAAQIPDSHLLVIPETGHSALTAEPTECGREAMLALFSGKQIKACGRVHLPSLLQPPPLPPTRLAQVSPTRGYHGRTGRTLHAISLTFRALLQETVIELLEALQSSRPGALSALRLGGLRSGWERYLRGTFFLHRYSYIPGVSLSGTIGTKGLLLRIGGSAAVHGTLRAGPHHRLVGQLGGEPIEVAARRVGLPPEAVTSSFLAGLGPFERSLRAHLHLGASTGPHIGGPEGVGSLAGALVRGLVRHGGG